MNVRSSAFLVLVCVRLLAAEPEPHSIFTPDGRFQFFGSDPQLLQTVAVWSGRGGRRLERKIGLPVPFQERVPFRMFFEDGVLETSLVEQVRGQELWQEISSTGVADLNTLHLADQFTRAMLSRIFFQAQPTAAPSERVPEWLVQAISHTLLDEMTPELMRQGLADWRSGRQSRPTGVTRADRPAGSGLPARAEALWTYRFLSERMTDPVARWLLLSRSPNVSPEQWATLTGDATGLREFHVEWDLWMSARDRSAIADLGDTARALDRLESLLRIRPALFGLAGEEVPRHETFRLPDLLDSRHELWVPALLQPWLVQLQLLRFRQPDVFLEILDEYQQAVLALQQMHQTRGRRRREALEHFEQHFEEAELKRRALRQRIIPEAK